MHVSAGCLEALARVDLPKSFLRFTVPTPAWHLGSRQASRKVMVSKRDSDLTGGKAKPVSPLGGGSALSLQLAYETF